MNAVASFIFSNHSNCIADAMQETNHEHQRHLRCQRRAHGHRRFGGSLKDVPNAQLATTVVKAAIARAGIAADTVVMVMGNVIH